MSLRLSDSDVFNWEAWAAAALHEPWDGIKLWIFTFCLGLSLHFKWTIWIKTCWQSVSQHCVYVCDIPSVRLCLDEPTGPYLKAAHLGTVEISYENTSDIMSFCLFMNWLFWPPHKCKSNIHSSFSLFFVFTHPSGILAVKCSTACCGQRWLYESSENEQKPKQYHCRPENQNTELNKHLKTP